MRQRLSVAMALLPDPEILFLDEPTSGLDVISAKMIKDILRNENKEGKTVLMTTHNLHEASELCNRIAVINKGRIIAIDTPERLRSMGAKHYLVVASLQPLRPVENALTSCWKIEYRGDKIRIHADDVDRTIKELAKYAVENNLRIVYLSTEMPSLEDVFVHLVEGDRR
jgi:ABC-2 type transport system ATP-binding protein